MDEVVDSAPADTSVTPGPEPTSQPGKHYCAGDRYFRGPAFSCRSPTGIPAIVALAGDLVATITGSILRPVPGSDGLARRVSVGDFRHAGGQCSGGYADPIV
jgi:hypothetical protein